MEDNKTAHSDHHLVQHWQASKHTKARPTDAYGTIEFQGGAHPIKAQYVRLSYDTPPEKILNLFVCEWKLELPKLLMSIHGGKANFELQPKLKKVIQNGLLKAAKTTGAWIFTGGTNSGVIKHVGEAFNNERSQTLRGHVVNIGISPWGILENRDDLLGKNVTVPYHSISSPKSKYAVLNNRHAYFLLVDDGTVGKYGSEIAFRKKLEKHISKQTIFTNSKSGKHSGRSPGVGRDSPRTPTSLESKPYGIPVVAVVIEGGTNTIRCVLEYVTDTPPVPVVVCDGTGRAADLLAFTHKYIQDNGSLPGSFQDLLLAKIEFTFDCTLPEAKELLNELIQCATRKDLITVFRLGEGPCQELDQAILTCLLKGSRLSAPDQLSLALAWNRVDIASTEIFVYGQEWTNEMLEEAMMEALACGSVDFVKLLLENGVNMSRFLTISRLEELYNTKRGSSNTLDYLIKDVTKKPSSSNHHHHYYTLLEIGLVIEKLMGGAYRSHYRKREFRIYYEAVKAKQAAMASEMNFNQEAGLDQNKKVDFPCPYNELLVWAVLMKRQNMALFVWQRGEEALAKALVAVKLYKRMAHEAAQDDLEADISEDFRKYSREFEELALGLLDYSYRQNDTIAQQMLTYELQNWSKQTCLSLAVSANFRPFLAHACCQILLADLWMGGLRSRKYTNLKVLLGLLCPPIILTLGFKSKEELKLMPQTEEEHISLNEDDVSESDGNSMLDVENGKPSKNRNNIQMNTVVPNGHLGGLTHQSSVDKIPISPRRKEALRLGKKIYEFYTAPLTKFLGYTITYFVFLAIFSFMVLVRMTAVPSWAEIYCLVYIISLSVEKVREIVAAEPVRFTQKCVVWMDNKWNPCDLVAIIIYFIAFYFRFYHDLIEVSRVFYACDIMYWYLRILHILSVNKYLGPYVTMIGKMVINMLYFVVLLLVVLMAFGVARQGILHPYEDPNWTLARDVFFKPYFMLYGEVFADTIDPPCGDGPDLTPCRTGRWVTIVAMCLYLLVANILLINLLIAVFNNIFLSVDAVAQQIWKSQRFHVVMEYEQKPVLPPPLIIVNHIYMLYTFVKQHCGPKAPSYCHVLKLFLSDKQLEAIYNFEEECVDGYFREKESERSYSATQLVRANTNRVEYLTQRLEDLYSRSSSNVASIQALKYNVRELTQEMKTTSGYLAVIHRYMSTQGTYHEKGGVKSDDADFGDGDDQDVIPGARMARTQGDLQDTHDDYLSSSDISNVEEEAEEEGEENESVEMSEMPLDMPEPGIPAGHCHWDTIDDPPHHNADEKGAFCKAEGGTPTITVSTITTPKQASAFYKKMMERRRRRSMMRFNGEVGEVGPLYIQRGYSSEPSSEPDTSKAGGETRHRRRSSQSSSGWTCNSDCCSPAGSPSFIVRRGRSQSSGAALGGASPLLLDPNVAIVVEELPAPSPTPNPVVHEYTSITDEIERNEMFKLAKGRLTVSGATANRKFRNDGGRSNRRRHSDVSFMTSQSVRSDTEQAILAKEQELRKAERQDYKRMAKVARRIKRGSDSCAAVSDSGDNLSSPCSTESSPTGNAEEAFADRPGEPLHMVGVPNVQLNHDVSQIVHHENHLSSMLRTEKDKASEC